MYIQASNADHNYIKYLLQGFGEEDDYFNPMYLGSQGGQSAMFTQQQQQQPPPQQPQRVIEKDVSNDRVVMFQYHFSPTDIDTFLVDNNQHLSDTNTLVQSLACKKYTACRWLHDHHSS